jgi:hypothetical protein
MSKSFVVIARKVLQANEKNAADPGTRDGSIPRLDWRYLIDLLCCFQKTLLSFGVVSAFVLLGEFMHYTETKDSMKDGWRKN